MLSSTLIKSGSLSEAKQAGQLHAANWQFGRYHSEAAKTIKNAENHSPEDVQAALQTYYNVVSETLGVTPEEAVKLIENDLIKGATSKDGNTYIAVGEGDQTNAISNSKELAETTAHEALHHVDGNSEEAAIRLGKVSAEAFENELGYAGIDGGDPDPAADLAWLQANKDNPLLKENLAELSNESFLDFDYYYAAIERKDSSEVAAGASAFLTNLISVPASGVINGTLDTASAVKDAVLYNSDEGSRERTKARAQAIIERIKTYDEIPADIAESYQQQLTAIEQAAAAGDIDAQARAEASLVLNVAMTVVGGAGVATLGAKGLASAGLKGNGPDGNSSTPNTNTTAGGSTSNTSTAGNGANQTPSNSTANTGNVSELETGTYGNLAPRSVRDGMTPDHIPSFASVRQAVEDAGVDLSPSQIRALRNNTNCVVVKTCDHQSFSRTYGGRNNQGQIQADAQDLRKAADADLDTWEPVWKESGWSDTDISRTRQEVHNLNRQKFEELGIPYGAD